MINNETLKLFPEPIFKYKFNDYQKFNEELGKYIYDLYEKDNKGIERSNRGGWHSENFKLGQPNSIQQKFAQEVQKYILNVFQNMGWKIKDKNIRLKEMWAIINKKNNFNVIHTHPNCYLSAAYYVKTHDGCGKIKFTNPNLASRQRSPLIENKTDFNQNGIEVDPKEGDLLFFPAYLTHEVLRNNSDKERIVISFNIDIAK